MDFQFLNSFNYTAYENLDEFVKASLNLAISFAVVVVVIAVIVAGFKYMFSRGDDEKVKEATRSLIFALIGLILVFISPMLVRFVLDKFL